MMRSFACLLTAFSLTASASAQLPKSQGSYVLTGSMPSPYATQAAAADEQLVYVVSDNLVVKYDRASGKELAQSKGKAQHLNSAFLHEGKVYAAHSNFPRLPHQSDLRVLDPATMELTIFHTFADPPGSLTWAVRRGPHWWCHFAHYGKDNANSVLVRYDDQWREQKRWGYPPELIADWGNYSLSGGLWVGDHLLTTGHDKRVIYRLKVPENGKVIEVIDVVPSPFPGQGIAVDTTTGGLVGIDRAKKQVVFAKFETR
jgi:hypothetical protein